MLHNTMRKHALTSRDAAPIHPATRKRPYGAGRVFYRPDRNAFIIAYRGGGREIREAAGPDEQAARRLLTRRLKEVERDSFVGPQEKRLTVAELLDARATHLANRGAKSGSSRSHMLVIRQHFGFEKAAAITAERLERFVAEERAANKKPATINRELEQLRAAYHLAVKQKRMTRGSVPYFPMQNERNNVRKGFFEAEDFDTFVRHLPPAIADVARFAYATGWRKSEIVTLKWDQIDRSAREVRLHDSKNGDGRTLALSGDAWALIEHRWQARSYTLRQTKHTYVSPLVFHRRGRPIQDFRKVWRNALKQAGLATDRLFHDLRRSAVRDMVRAGVNQSVAMSISGHKTVSMFLRYKITSGDEQREALERTAQVRRQRTAGPTSPKITAVSGGQA